MDKVKAGMITITLGEVNIVPLTIREQSNKDCPYSGVSSIRPQPTRTKTLYKYHVTTSIANTSSSAAITSLPLTSLTTSLVTALVNTPVSVMAIPYPTVACIKKENENSNNSLTSGEAAGPFIGILLVGIIVGITSTIFIYLLTQRMSRKLSIPYVCYSKLQTDDGLN